MKIATHLNPAKPLRFGKSSAGFTFLELLVVCAITGILAAIALPAYVDYTNRAKIAESLTITADIRHSIAKYYVYTGKFPVDNYAVGIAEADTLTGKYTQSITIENGAIQLLFSDVSADLAGKTISLRPVIVKSEPTAPIYFSCGNAKVSLDNQEVIGENKTNLKEKWLPSSCRK